MIITAFAGIHAAIEAALLAPPALADGRVSINRLRPIAAGSHSAAVVRLERSKAMGQTLGALDWTTSYSVECYTRAAAGADPAAAVDDFLNAAWERLSALVITDLGVMAIALNPEIDWQYDEADTPVICVTIRLDVEHRTALNSLKPRA